MPGLGAFVLRPTADGHGAEAGVGALSRFIDDVLEHVAAQGTSRERAGYWEGESYQVWAANSEAPERRLDPVEFLEMPPDDTLVLLGYVKGDAHRRWILDNQLYNIRADEGRRGAIGLDSAELRASLLVLYNPEWEEAELYRLNGAMYLRTADELVSTGYPAPGGERYLCMGLVPLDAMSIPAQTVAALARKGREAKPVGGTEGDDLGRAANGSARRGVMSKPLDLEEVKEYLRRFADERDWNQFHTPKNLAMALAGEAGELLEVFQWLTPEESLTLEGDNRRAAEDELADVLQYVVRLADVLQVDLGEVVWRKLSNNAVRYPASEVRGSSDKRR